MYLEKRVFQHHALLMSWVPTLLQFNRMLKQNAKAKKLNNDSVPM